MKSIYSLALCFMALSTIICARTLEDVRAGSKFGGIRGTVTAQIKTDNLPEYKASAADQTAFLAVCKTVASVFARHPLMAAPRGFNAYNTVMIPSLEYSSAVLATNGMPLIADCSLTMRDFGDDGKGGYHESISTSAGVVVHINSLMLVFSGMHIYNEGAGDDLFYQPKKTGTFNGHPRYHDVDSMIVLNASKKPLWLPVSAEEFITVHIRRTEAERDKTLAGMKGPLSPKEIVDSGKAEREKAFTEAYLMLKKTNPKEAEQAKKEFNEAEKQFAKEAASHKESGDDIRAQNQKIYDDRIAALKRELTALSALQRKAQAVFVGESDEHPSGLGSPTDENARHIVRVNRDYFNDGLPRSAVRLLIITFSINGGYADTSAFDTEQEDHTLEDFIAADLAATLDWKKIFSVAGI
ncbi:MAG: hypothetical protein HZC28_18970 [Spirochaetes bacterium]|nr:hypothetical protein [Spirochaetota bacterium]